MTFLFNLQSGLESTPTPYYKKFLYGQKELILVVSNLKARLTSGYWWMTIMMNGNQVLKCDLLEIFFPMILWCAHWYISLRWCHARIICDWGFQSHLVVIIEAKSHITLNAARWIFSLKTIRFSLGFPFVASLRQESQVSDPDYLNSSTLSPPSHHYTSQYLLFGQRKP